MHRRHLPSSGEARFEAAWIRRSSLPCTFLFGVSLSLSRYLAPLPRLCAFHLSKCSTELETKGQAARTLMARRWKKETSIHIQQLHIILKVCMSFWVSYTVLQFLDKVLIFLMVVQTEFPNQCFTSFPDFIEFLGFLEVGSATVWKGKGCHHEKCHNQKLHVLHVSLVTTNIPAKILCQSWRSWRILDSPHSPHDRLQLFRESLVAPLSSTCSNE